MARTSHGILYAEYHTSVTTSAGTGTEVANLIADESQIAFLDEEGNPVDVHGNEYPGVLYAEFTIAALDLTAFAALKSGRASLTKYYWLFTLSNSAKVYVTSAKNVRISSIKPLDIQGRKQGRADGFMCSFRIPYDDLTFA